MNLTQVLLFLFQGLSKSVDLPHAGLGTASLRGKERWTVKGGFICKWAGSRLKSMGEEVAAQGEFVVDGSFSKSFPLGRCVQTLVS